MNKDLDLAVYPDEASRTLGDLTGDIWTIYIAMMLIERLGLPMIVKEIR